MVAIAAIPPAVPLDSGSGGGVITEANPSLAGKWINKTDTPFKGGRGEAVVGTDDYIYVARCWDKRSASLFYRYNPDNDSWAEITGLQKGAFRTGTASAWDNGNYIYALLGARYFYKINSHYYPENRYLFYRYNISNDTWDPPLTLNNTPYPQGAGDAITWCNYDNKSYIYAMMGKSTPSHGGIHYGYLARYYPDSDKWESLTFNPNWTCTDDGSSLVWTGGKYLYALQGEVDEKNGSNNNNFSRYDIDNDKWEDMANIPEGSCDVGDGASLLWVGGGIPEYSNYIFALGGGGAYDPEHPGKEPPGYNFYCYNISKNNWTRLESVPYPVGTWVGNRLGFANGHIYYWQGAPKTEEYDHNCSGKAFYMFEFLSAIFDTGLPKNPYPRIFGTHNGTIASNKTITVSKLYTYPCVGTGGHTKYARTWNKTWEGTEARWRSYQGDWKNISFNESFVLYAGETYNYTIRTGSYSQIHHTPALQTANGWINCTEFVDVNGKKYKYWIPAIRLTHDEETLWIGAFNVQVFGKSKASKPEVMDVLGKIIRTYDVIAIQEIRDKSQTALLELVNTVNSDNSEYDYVVSERLGRTTIKEQYAYIYNTQTVELTSMPYTYPESAGTDPFHRESYIASFKALNGNFDVTLIVIHTDPDEATEEINALDAVVRYAQSVYPDEQDFFVMGDLNADCSYFDEDSNSTISRSDYYWYINNSVDTTTKPTNCTYDRIIIMTPAVADFTGDSGVFRYDIEYGLTSDETTAVSDHYPVYAEFWSNRDNDSAPTPTPEQTPTPTSIETAPTVYISDLNLVDEWVKITNSGTSQVTMTGWKITDEMMAILQNSMMLTGI